jgi:hypothetical protein
MLGCLKSDKVSKPENIMPVMIGNTTIHKFNLEISQKPVYTLHIYASELKQNQG